MQPVECMRSLLKGQPFWVEMWYGRPEWVVGLFIVAFLIAIIAAFWIFYDVQRRFREATIYQALTVVATVLILPSVILRIIPCWVSQSGMRNIVAPLAGLGIVAGLVALFAFLGYAFGIGVREYVPPVPPSVPTPRPLPSVPAEEVPPTELAKAPAYEVPPPAPAPAETISLRRPPPRLAWLVLRSGPRIGKEFRLGEVTNIGRDATMNDIVIDDPAMSRQHAKIRLEDEQFVLYDLASLNGTFVNDEQIQKRALVNGDMIRMGETLFTFMELKEKKKEEERQ